jgi:hypothetical protein
MSERNVLVFSNSHYDDAPYDKWLEGTGYRLWMIVSDSKSAEHAHLADVSSFPDYWNNPEIDQTALDLVNKHAPSRIIARCEPDVLRAAKLRDITGVAGQGWDSAVAFRDKVVMKQTLAKGNIAVPAFARLDIPLDLFHFVQQHGYPLVVKPTTGSGSVDTHVLRDEQDLQRLLARGIPPYTEVEQFIEGPMYIVDGLVVDNELVAAHPSRYVNDCLSFRATHYLGTVMLDAGNAMHSRLVEYTKRVLAQLPTPEHTTFHLEVFHTPEDELVLCEVASRTAGGMIPATLRAATGLDIDRAWFNAQMGLPQQTPLPRPGQPPARSASHVLIYPRRGTLGALPHQAPPETVQYLVRATAGARYGGDNRSGDWIAGYVMVTDSEDAAEMAVHETAKWFEASTTWHDLEEPTCA